MTSKEAQTVLIVSTKYDPHVDFLIPRLTERHIPFLRFNTEDFPLRSKLTIAFDENGYHREMLSLPNSLDATGENITWEELIGYTKKAYTEFYGRREWDLMRQRKIRTEAELQQHRFIMSYYAG